MIDLESFDLATLPSLLLEEKNQLPSSIGVYFVVTGDQLLYIGRSRNLFVRWKAHNRLRQLSQYTDVRIHWLELNSIPLSVQIEEALINHFEPEFNGKGDGISKKIVINVPDDLYCEFKIYALKLGTTMNTLLGKAIEKMIATRGS